jgi:hypothetical protein
MRCTYRCSCDLYYIFDHKEKRCVKLTLDNILDEVFGQIFQQLPLTIIAYLAFVCAYSIRSELKKIASPGGKLYFLPTLLFCSSSFPGPLEDVYFDTILDEFRRVFFFFFFFLCIFPLPSLITTESDA